MGLTEEDMKQHHPLVQRALSLDNASIGEFKTARFAEIRKIFARHERDTATPPITACALCEKVLAVLSHIKKNKNDMTAYLKLQKYLTKRRKYLLYLKRTDFNSYSYVIKYYGLKDFEDHQHKTFKRIPVFDKTPRVEHGKRFPLQMNRN
jgi:ribosomal protein S15